MEKLRNRIDEIDKKITELFEERMDVVKKVAEYKLNNNLPVLNSGRENDVIKKNIGYLKNDIYAPYLKQFYLDLMNTSKEYQKTLISKTVKIGFQGIPGSFSHEATLKFLASDSCSFANSPCEIGNYETFEKLMNGLLNNEVDYIVIPFENTSTGAVADVYDLLIKYDFYINGQVCVKVNHNLIAKPNVKLANIKEIYSHPQAFMQCKEYLKSYNAKQIPYFNTAISAKYVSESNRLDIAAIASEAAAKLYGLKVLEHNINYNNNNITKFVVLGKKDSGDKNANKISAVLSIKHEVGSLYELLGSFTKNGVNILKLESRPDINNPFEYIFFMDFEGNINDEKVVKLFDTLKNYTAKFKYLGNYIC